MGATYLSMQLRTTDRDAAVAALEAIAVAKAASGLQFYVTEPVGGWLGIFPNFTPELERTAKALSGQLVCLVVLLLCAAEDDLYCMFFRDGKQLPWFKVGAPPETTRQRAGQARRQAGSARRGMRCTESGTTGRDSRGHHRRDLLVRATARCLRGRRHPKCLHQFRVSAARRTRRARDPRRADARAHRGAEVSKLNGATKCQRHQRGTALARARSTGSRGRSPDYGREST